MARHMSSSGITGAALEGALQRWLQCALPPRWRPSLLACGLAMGDCNPPRRTRQAGPHWNAPLHTHSKMPVHAAPRWCSKKVGEPCTGPQQRAKGWVRDPLRVGGPGQSQWIPSASVRACMHGASLRCQPAGATERARLTRGVRGMHCAALARLPWRSGTGLQGTHAHSTVCARPDVSDMTD